MKQLKVHSSNQTGTESRLGLLALFSSYYQITKHYMGIRLYVLFGLNLLSILMESLGLLLFIPFFRTLEIGGEPSDVVSRSLYRILNGLGIEVTVSVSLLLLVSTFTLKGIVVFFIGAYRRYISAVMRFDIREELIEKSSQLDYQYAIKKSTGFLGNLVTSETNRAIDVMHAYCHCLTSFFTTMVFVVTALLLHPQLSIIILLAGVLNALLLLCISKLGRRYSQQVSHLNSQLNGLLIELLQSSKYMKATAQFSALKRLIHKTNKSTVTLQLKQNLANSAYEAVREPILVVCICSIIYFYVVIAEQNIALILVPILFFYRCMLEVGFVQANWQLVCDDSGGLENLFHITREFEENREINSETRPAIFDIGIEFRNLSFSYGEAKVLRNVNISIPKYSSVAFVGTSGEGKTTVADLITGIIKPQNGAVYLDGINLSTVNPNTFRSKIGYVVQDTVIFSDSVANNISMQLGELPSPEAIDRIKQVARLSHVDEFVSEMPEGYQTLVGERGIRLSGGQRQRIAIARELYRKPEILILDESTSALDSMSENFIQQSIRSLLGKVTLVIISHRLSTISNVDQIYVMQKGKVIERGTFDELFNTEGSHFQELCKLQQLALQPKLTPILDSSI